MARLHYIKYHEFEAFLTQAAGLGWGMSEKAPIEKLPQIFGPMVHRELMPTYGPLRAL